MSKIDECIKAKAAEGKVSAKKAVGIAQNFRDDVDTVKAMYGLSTEEAEKAVAATIVGIREEATLVRKAEAAAQFDIIQDLQTHVKKHIDAGEGADVGVYGRLSFDPTSRYTGPSLDARTFVVKGIAHRRIDAFLKQFRRRNVGTTQKLDGIEDVVREIQGKDTGSTVAKEMAGGIKDALEYLMGRMQRAGVSLSHQEASLFHRWDNTRVARVTQDEWIDSVWNHIDRENMISEIGLPISDKDLRLSLQEIYKSVTTRGLVDVAELGDRAGQVVTRGRREATNLGMRKGGGRFLKWKSPDSWMEVHKMYGRGNLFEHISATIDSLSRDVAIAEVLGPHPKATLTAMEREMDTAFANQALSKTGMAAAKAAEKIGGPKSQLHALFNVVTGNANVTDLGIVASISQANRNVFISSLLGSSFLSAISDTALASVTARMNGMPVGRTVGRIMKIFAQTPVSTLDRELAINLGFTAQGWSDRAIGAQRVMGEITGDRFTERMTDVVMRASLLSPWTEAGRYGFQTEMLSHISSQASKRFDELDKATKESFQRHGIEEADWEIIRTTQKWKDPETGAQFIRAEDVAAQGDEAFEAGNKLQEAIFIETEFAIPQSNPRIQARMTGGNAAGTFWGEVSRNTAMFKSFPVSIMFLHWQRAMRARNPITKAEYVAWGLIGMTMMGALGEQAINISKGKKPEPMDAAFWNRAWIRGGSGGLFADTLFRESGGFGSNIITDLLGPVARQADLAISDLGAANVSKLLKGEETTVGRDLTRLLNESAPGHTLFYLRLAYERILLDEIKRATDPKAANGFRRIRKRVREEQDTTFFSPPGQGLF